jgi:hypothetical protein
MRRAAVLMVLLVCGTGCTERLLLPGSQSNGGTTGNPDAGSGSGLAGGRSGNGGAGGSTCKNRTLIRSMSQPKADLLLLVGRNPSMSTHFVDDTSNPSNPTNTTRMTAVQSILDGLVTSYQFTVNFGYLEFPGAGAASCSSACCADAPSVIPPSPFSFAAIDKALRQCDGAPNMFGCVSQSDARPLADTFKSAAGVFASLNSSGEQYAVLLIDGAPACGSEDPSSSCMAAKGQMGAQLLQQDNINLSIVTVGQDAEGVMCLQSIAETSGTAGNPYQARDTSQLLDSLTTIVTGAAQGACKIDLLTAVADPSQVSVTVFDSSGMGTLIPKDPSGQNGWKFVSGSSQSRIVVQGPACQTVQKVKPTDVQVWYGCPP